MKFANEHDIPFLAYNGVHGATTTLGKMTRGISISLEKLTSIAVSPDGRTVTAGGGTNSKALTDHLWPRGKQTVTGTCECVSYLGPALGGGHGWLQGRHGLMADQFVSLRVVLADGSVETVDEGHELMWAMKGAGHNFGIVTSVTSKIYDIKHRDWAIETLIFTGDKVRQVYDAANALIHYAADFNGQKQQPVDVIHWSYWLMNPDVDPVNPVILFFLIQEGVSSVDPAYSKPFHDIGPAVVTPETGDYRQLGRWTGIDAAAPPCQKDGLVNPRFPIYLERFNVDALVEAYAVYAEGITSGGADGNPFSHSLFMFEAYSHQGMRRVPGASTAFAYRDDNILAAPLITYTPAGEALDQKAAQLGNRLRQVLHAATGRREYHSYVNYAYGNEANGNLYGAGEDGEGEGEGWRLCRLRELKRRYDPRGRFSFYNPIVPRAGEH